MQKKKKALAWVLVLMMLINFCNITYNHEIVKAESDTKLPIISNAKIEYNDEKGYVEFTAEISDQETGIQSIKYEINPQDLNSDNSEYLYEYGKNENEYFIEGNNDEFKSELVSIKTNAKEKNFVRIRISPDKLNNGINNVIKFVVKDNSGNTLVENSQEKKYMTYVNKSYGPTISNLKIESVPTKAGAAAKNFSEISENKYNNKLTIMKEDFLIKFDIKGTSGIKDIQLCDGNENLVKGMKEASIDKKGDTVSCTFKIEKVFCVNDLSIKVIDENNYVRLQKVKPMIENFGDKIVYENKSVVVSPKYEKCILSSDNKNWVNINGGNLALTIEDLDSGIKSYSVYIKEKKAEDTTYEMKASEEFSEYTTKYEKKVCPENEGAYTYKINTEDNAGNKKTYYYDIYVDQTEPEITCNVASGIQNINSQEWCDINSNIDLDINLKESKSPLKDIVIKANNKNVKIDNKENIIKEQSGKISIPIAPYVNADNNDFSISITVISDSGNSDNWTQTYKVDKDNPRITKVEVTGGSDGTDDVTAITSGVYSNEKITIKVSAEDAGNETGISEVVVSYLEDEERITKKAILTDNGTYDVVLEAAKGESICRSDIIISAYDKMGHKNTQTPAMQNIKNESAGNNFVMQENKLPKLVFDLPDSDSSTIKDGTIWYSKDHELILSATDEESGVKTINVYVNNILIVNNDAFPQIITEEDETNSRGDKQKITYTLSTDNICKYLEMNNAAPEDGKYSLYIEVIDNANNSIIDNTKIFYVDECPPVVSEISFSKRTIDGIEKIDSFSDDTNYKYFFDGEISLNVKVEDEKPSSGLNKVSYKLVYMTQNGNSEVIEKESSITDEIAIIDIPEDFKGIVYIKAYDFVDNPSEEVSTGALVIDAKGPQINISEFEETDLKDKNGDKLFDKDISYDVTITDTESGIKDITSTLKSDENETSTQTVIDQSRRYEVGENLENGWVVTSVDENLVTGVSKKFEITEDVNNYVAEFVARDGALNNSVTTKTETISIDKTAPVIEISFPEGLQSDPSLYNKNCKAEIDITVYERNFDQGLIVADIENTYTNVIPKFNFDETADKYVYKSRIVFTEGDYSINLSGTDMVGHKAIIKFNNTEMETFSTQFSVDETAPVISTNFSSFTAKDSTDKENLFNKEKVATITCTEHNFDSESMNVKVYEKMPGESYEVSQENESGYVVYSEEGWIDDNANPDLHTLTMKFSNDGIYKIEISPKDRAENEGTSEQTAIFEIDTTAPVIVSRNDEIVEPDDTSVLGVYGYENKDDAAPKVEFDDIHFDHIEYSITRFTPEYNGKREISEISSELITAEVDKKEFKLPEFEKDGVYSVDIIAVDKAGNKSTVVQDTYMRMVNTDVLAYIEDSHPATDNTMGTGWYSIEDEDGPLSKRPDTFEDMKIAVFTKKSAQTKITLNSNDGEEIVVDTELKEESAAHGVNLCRYTLSGDYFKNNFKEDTDASYYLTVNTSGKSVELGEIHIDNIAPECNVPSYYHDGGWMMGVNPEPIKITDINEKIDTKLTKVYVDGKEVEYKYDSKENTLSFNVGGADAFLDLN